MDFDSGWLFKANYQKTVMLFLPVFGKTLVRGNQHTLFMYGFLPKLLVIHALIVRSSDIKYIITLFTQFDYCCHRDIFIHQDSHNAFSTKSIGVICSSAKDAA